MRVSRGPALVAKGSGWDGMGEGVAWVGERDVCKVHTSGASSWSEGGVCRLEWWRPLMQLLNPMLAFLGRDIHLAACWGAC